MSDLKMKIHERPADTHRHVPPRTTYTYFGSEGGLNGDHDADGDLTQIAVYHGTKDEAGSVVLVSAASRLRERMATLLQNAGFIVDGNNPSMLKIFDTDKKLAIKIAETLAKSAKVDGRDYKAVLSRAMCEKITDNEIHRLDGGGSVPAGVLAKGAHKPVTKSLSRH